MKFNIQREKLIDILKVMKSIASVRSPKAILKNTKIEWKDSELYFSATDLEVGVRMKADILEGEEGETVALPAEKFANIVNECPASEFEVNINDKRAIVKAGKSKFILLGESGEDFPIVEDFNEEGSFNIKASELLGMINKTIIAVSPENTRYALNGIFVMLKDGFLEMVGADGRRLAYTKKEIENVKDIDINGIIPNKTMRELQRMVSGVEGDIKIKIDENRFSVYANGITLISQLVDGKYPDYKDIIPKNCTNQFKFDREELIVALKQAKLLVGEESRAVEFNFTENGLELKSHDAEAGESTVLCGVEGDLKELKIGFDPNYLLEGISVSDSEKINLNLKDASAAGLIEDEKGYLYVLMPMKIRG